MNRREFLTGIAALGVAGCKSGGWLGDTAGDVRFGVCTALKNAPLLKSVGYDYFEWGVADAFGPNKDEEWWKRQRDAILAAALPLYGCNGFLPGSLRLTGPNAKHEPALKYAETALRRAEEVGVKAIVFGSGGARNVPGDYLAAKAADRPNVELGARQYGDFCRELTRRVADLQKVTVVIEPLRPNESNIINFVWQGLAICREVNSPRLGQLADIYHMMMGGESSESIVKAGSWMKHCHVAAYNTRLFPGSDPATVDKLRPYFDALKAIGYRGGISCECSWGKSADLAKNLEIALKTMKGLI